MTRLLSAIVITLLTAFSIFSAPGSSQEPPQQEQKTPLPTGEKLCIDMAFHPVATGGDNYSLRFQARSECAGCRVEQVESVIVLNTQFCGFATSYEGSGSSAGMSIQLDHDSQAVLLKGADESRLRETLRSMCEKGGVAVPINSEIKVEHEENEIELEFENGSLKRIAGPVPMTARVTIRDSCQKNASVMMNIKPD
jgi:hypothetical protein